MQVLNGRYGPYITDGKKNGKIPKDRDPKSLSLEECQAILAAAPERKGRWGRKAAPKAAADTPSGAEASAKKPVRKKAAAKSKAKAAPKKKAAAKKKSST